MRTALPRGDLEHTRQTGCRQSTIRRCRQSTDLTPGTAIEYIEHDSYLYIGRHR